MNEKELKVLFCVYRLHLLDPYDIAKEIGESISEVNAILGKFQRRGLLEKRKVGYRVKYWRIYVTPKSRELARELFENLETCPLCGGNLSTYSVRLAGREVVRVKCEGCGRKWDKERWQPSVQELVEKIVG